MDFLGAALGISICPLSLIFIVAICVGTVQILFWFNFALSFTLQLSVNLCYTERGSFIRCPIKVFVFTYIYLTIS